jgi:hypothetical protein
VAIKSCKVTTSGCEFAVWNLLHITLLAPRTLRRRLDSENLCTSAKGYVCLSHSRVRCSASILCVRHFLCDATAVNYITLVTGNVSFKAVAVNQKILDFGSTRL